MFFILCGFVATFMGLYIAEKKLQLAMGTDCDADNDVYAKEAADYFHFAS